MDFKEFTLRIFHKNIHYQNVHFEENSENHEYGEFVKIQKFTPSNHFCDFFSKMIVLYVHFALKGLDTDKSENELRTVV